MSRLDDHATISIAFSVDRILEVLILEAGRGGVRLSEVAVESPWVKDYDAIKGEGPTRWRTRFDTSNWGLLAAHDGGDRIGGAVIACNTANVHMLEGQRDVAVLWDLRVRADVRSSGVGTSLFRAAEEWSLSKGCRTLKVETQNINLPACRFYARMGCELGAIDRYAYPDFPEETQLVWFKGLTHKNAT
jgi:GNAT superfamily N-acetyltransferase